MPLKTTPRDKISIIILLYIILYLQKTAYFVYCILFYTRCGAFFTKTRSDYGSSTTRCGIFFYLYFAFGTILESYPAPPHTRIIVENTNRSGNNSVATKQYTHTHLYYLYIMCIFRRRFIGYRANNTTRVMLYIIIILYIRYYEPSASAVMRSSSKRVR